MRLLAHRHQLTVLATAFVASFSLQGCGNPVVDSDFEVGTGTWRFEPLEDGDTVQLVRGAQGGWHIWFSARSTNPEDGGTLSLSIRVADESRPASHRIDLTPVFDPQGSDGYHNFLGWAAQLNNPECLVGELMRIEASLEAYGEVLTDERDIVIGAGNDPPGECSAE